MVLDNLDRVQLTLDYMEQNLKTEIQVKELSRMAGYSEAYYSELFKKVTGISMGQYLTRRKLAHAICEIAAGRRMLETALEYGFDTYAGFYKAFCREYGCSPAVYLKDHNPVRPYRINLNQEEKIMLSKKAIRGILAHWVMEQETVGQIYYEGSGRSSENDFQVGKEYILKTSALPGGLKRHIEISQALKESDIHVSEPVPAKDGKLIVQDGEVYCILCRSIKGSHLDSRKLFAQGDEETAYRFGEIIGKLHLALSRLDQDICKENHLYDSVRTQAFQEIRKKAGLRLPTSFEKEYFGELYKQLPKQVIHRNMNLSYIFVENGSMTGVTDFELSEYGIRLFDPCYAATGILSENFTDRKECISRWLPLYRKILKGYDDVVHLTEEEQKAVPYVVFSIQLICTSYFSGKEKYEDLAEINECMLMRLIEHKEELCFDI
ncbi:MAG: helix-turn-helix domain-containing protein [Lachnospiraceae bacterium]|nr:helix-turn-helix domain-containing protein [Lachnospiraceae bacterium]